MCEEEKDNYTKMSGWVGSLDDFKSIINDFRKLRNEIISKEIEKLEIFYINSLRSGDVPLENFMQILDKRIEKLKNGSSLNLIIKDRSGDEAKFEDKEIDEALNKLILKRVDSFELHIRQNSFLTEISDRTSIKLFVSDRYSHLTFSSDSDVSKHAFWIKKRLKINRPKFRILRSRAVGITSLTFETAIFLFYLFAFAPKMGFPMAIVAQIGCLLIHFSLILGVPKLLKALNPMIEIHPNDKNSTLIRSIIWSVSTFIALSAAIAAIIAVIPQ